MSDDDSPFETSKDDADYEGVEWIGGEAFYLKKKEKRRPTREDNIYGVFVEEDKETEEKLRRNKSRGVGSSSHNVSFVSSGWVEGGEKVQRSDGIEISLPKKKEVHEQATVEAEVQDSLPTSFGQRVREGAMKRQREEQEREDLKKAWKQAGSTGFASFEQHSRGIASKLMQKMGYKPGEGLGAQKQGVLEPLMQKMRPKSMGMGYGDFKEQGIGPASREQVEEEQDEEPDKKPEIRPRLWKASTAKERKKRQFRTAEEVLHETEEAWKAPVLPTILDMRGPKARVLTDFGKINEDVPDDGRPMPELQHNMDLLVEMTENEIKNVNAKQKTTEDIAVLMGREEKKLQQEHKELEEEIQKLTALMDTLDVQIAQLDPLTQIDDLLNTCSALKDNARTEFIACNIAAIVVDKVVPYFERLYRNWDPFESMETGLDDIGRWSPVLSDHLKFSVALEENPLALLLIHTVVPPLRMAIVNRWTPRRPEPLLEFLDAWKHVLPDKLTTYICHSLVFPKLKTELEKWDPCKDAIPVHVWMHPWLLWMSKKLNQLYPIIIHKLVNALQAWKPSDSTAHMLLSPWKTVFSEKQWEDLLTKAILPKLAKAVQEYEVNPLTHDFGVIQDLIEWAIVIPKQHLVNILDAFFFPKWLRILHYWLTHDPDLGEVSNWYVSWKSLFPAPLLEDVTINSHFGKALDMMNRTTEGMTLPSVNVILGEGRPVGKQRVAVVSEMPKAMFTLRDMVQKFAEDNNVSFMPKPGRTHEGFQVYGFGKVSVVMDNTQNIVRAQYGHIWKPVSLEQLFAEMQNRQ